MKKKIEYWITLKDYVSGGYHLEPKTGEFVSIEGHDCAVCNESGYYTVTHLPTGMAVYTGLKKKKESIEAAANNFKTASHVVETATERVMKELGFIGYNFPVNNSPYDKLTEQPSTDELEDKTPSLFSPEHRAYVARTFNDFFKVPFKGFYDKMSPLYGRVILDVFRFDDHLHSQFGQYEDGGLSMRELVVQKYGEDAAEFLDTLL